MAGFPLTGVDPNDPIPGIIREIRFQQGLAAGSGKARSVVLIGNKVAAGSEPDDTLGAPIDDQQNMIDRAGYRSELLLMYRAAVAVDPEATYYMIAVPEGPGATASSCTLTLTASPGPGATAVTVAQVSLFGEVVEVTVQTGDLPATIAANLAAAISNQIFWPVTAAVGSGANAHIVTITCANKGPRGDYVLRTLRAKTAKAVGITVAKSAITSGTVDDDHTAAFAQLDSADIYYQISAKTTLGDGSAGNPAVSPTDSGIGEHAEFVRAQSLPSIGKGCIAIFALCGTSAQAATVGLAVNNVRVVLFHAKNPEWTPAMIAAHYGAVKRVKEIVHPGANLRWYGLKGGDVSQLPDPYTKLDRLSRTEQRSDLNNGVTPIAHTSVGKAYIVRQITTACQTNGNYDYRARSGHIPSCSDYFWDSVKASYASQMQDFVAADPPKGQKPLANVQYPSALRAIVNTEIDRAIDFPGGPYLDPSVLAAMKDATQVAEIAGGLSVRATPVAVKHNNKGQFLFLESSEPS